MSLQHTHDVDGARVSQCTCGTCGNTWWVKAALEHQPSYCCYCGTKFVWYDDPDGREFGMSGLPREG